MRHLLVALMIVLLPLRGWVSDAMATEMAPPTLAHQLVVGHSGGGVRHADAAASPTYAHAASAPAGATVAAADCVGHTGSLDPASTDASHCQSCVVCQVCYSVALVLPRFDISIAFTSPVLPLYKATSFTSADRAPGLKPPIS